MIRKKRVKLISVILATLATVSLVFASALTVIAQDSTPLTFEEVVATNNEEVIASGIIAEGALKEGEDFGAFISNPIEENKVAQANEIVRLAGVRSSFANAYSDEKLADIAEERRINQLAGIRDEALEKFTVDGSLFASVLWQDAVNALEAEFKASEKEILDILEADEQAYLSYAKEKASSVVDYYNALLENTHPGSSTEYNTFGYYSAGQQSVLKSVLNEYVEAGQAEEEWLLKDSTNSIAYDPKKVNECKAKVDEITAEAKKALEGVPRNDFEIAHQAYLDFIEFESNPHTTAERDAKVAELKTLCTKAFYDYENKFTQALKDGYKVEYEELKSRIEFIDKNPNYAAIKNDSITDKYGVVKIVAKYASGSKKGQNAKVIPEGSVLYVYAGSNSSAKRIVSKTLQESDKKLSVAYYLTFRVERDGYKYIKLPTEIDSESSFVPTKISYEVTIDLESYYEKYCKAGGYEKEKLSNITDASEIVSELENASICYGYENGKAEKLDYTLEGGVLVFTTTAHLTNLCIAGYDLESLFTQPLFWVACVVALILLIIIIKIIVKHVRYRIKFVSNGGSHVRSVRAAKGEYFVMPEDPVKPGYVFSGWFTDKALTHKFIGTCMLRRKGFKLYAKWAAPVTVNRLINMYDQLRDLMRSYKKESYKVVMGLTETEKIATMYFKGNHIQLNVALDAEGLMNEGINVTECKDKKFAEVPSQLVISTEEAFNIALMLINRVLLNKGLQKMADYVPGPGSTEEERKNGFTYMIRNARVASTAEDYFDLLRIALKSYVMEENNGKFRPGDKVTLSRIYIEKEVAHLYLPQVKGDKALKGKRKARFADTPVEFKILVPRDMLEAYDLIDKVMKHNGLTKNPENANDLADVKVPATNGFAYTLVF